MRGRPACFGVWQSVRVHFIQRDAEAVDIDARIIALTSKDLRCACALIPKGQHSSVARGAVSYEA